MVPSIALIADGRLFVVGLDGKSKRHDCQFANDIERREREGNEKNSWMRGREGGGMFESATWGKRGQVTPSVRPRIVGVVAGDRRDSMAYSLWTGVVGAFLDFDFSEAYERRVFHKENFHISQFDRNPTDGRLLCRVGNDFESDIALLDTDGRNARAVTEGDSVDGAPSWLPQSEEAFVYHSAGLSRDANGYVHGLGPFGIHRINLKSGEMETLVENGDHDFLAPQVDANGDLYYIRRNYLGLGGLRPSAWATLKDVLLFPFRLIRAFVDFFQIFSQLVSKKPLSSSGGPKSQGPDPVQLWIHGRMIDLKAKSQKQNAEGALAPSDWVLVRRSGDGQETVLAKHVLSFDLAADGRILWSDGANLHIIAPGFSKKLLSEPLIDSVKWIEPTIAAIA